MIKPLLTLQDEKGRKLQFRRRNRSSAIKAETKVFDEIFILHPAESKVWQHLS
jgi:hypothetical protein